MIPIKTSEEIEIMIRGGKILAGIMKELKNGVKPGITTQELDKVADDLILKSGAKPSFKGYRGFPNALCTSINEEIVHASPSKRTLEDGDILSLDLGILYRGFHTDMAVTILIGSVDPEVNRLIKATKKALKRAIVRCKPGKTIGDIGHAIEKHIKDQGFEVIRDLCGHGVGKQLHEEPEVLNFGQRHKGPELKPGMVLAIEPMATIGKPGIKKGPDGHSYITIDNSFSAQFEHTVLVTEKGPRVLTE
ncbi:MAG: type I methionyl aminopeptidase [Candidatus Portnoybacteria bacterium]